MHLPRTARRIALAVLAAPAILAAVAATPTTTHAQASVVANATAVSAYVWRGVTFASVPGFQADLGLLAPLVGGSLSIGVWTSGELTNASSGRAITMVPSRLGAPTFTTIAPWADFTRSVGRVAATAGAMVYVYPEVTGFAADYNTTELYAKLAITAPLSPRLAVYYDVDKIRGAYLEGSVAQGVPLGPIAAAVPGAALSLGATAGVSAGQGEQAGQTAYFAREGLAFTDLAATASVPFGPVGLSTAAHLTLGHDPLARLVDATGGERSAKAWVTVTATYLLSFGRPPAE